MEHKFENSNNSQSGITMLLSIILLAAITTISFSLSSITLIEVRTSADVQRTEPSLYNDQGIVEEAIFAVKRRATTSAPAPKNMYFGENCDTNFVPYYGPVDAISSEVKICDIDPKRDIIVRIPPTALSYLTGKRFYLYDPANYGYGAGGYNGLKVKNTGAINLSLYLCPLDHDCVAEGGGWIAGADGQASIGPGEEKDFSGAISPNSSYELVIQKTQSGTVDGYAEVITQPKGLPYLSKKAVDIRSTFSGLSRILRTLIPTR